MSYKIYANMIRYNANTRGARTGDCVKRALSVAYSMDYDEVAKELNQINKGFGYSAGYSHGPVFNEFLKRRGDKFTDVKPTETVEEFCNSHPNGVYLLLVGKASESKSTHMVAVVDGDFYDSWNSSKNLVYAYTPISGGKSGSYAIDYVECLKTLFHFAEDYVVSLQKQCPDCITVTTRSVTQDTSEPDTGEIILRCYFHDNVPNGLSWKARKYSGHTVVVKFNPRLSEDENVDILKKKVKQKIYSWVYSIRREIADEIEAESITPHKDFRYDKRELLILPEWARPLATFVWDHGNSNYGSRYEVTLEAFPDDPRAQDNQYYDKVRFRADTLKELKEQLEIYKKDYSRIDYDY